MKIRLLPLLAVFGVFIFSAICNGAESPRVAGEPRVYKRTAEGELSLYIVKPDAWRPGDRRPAIVFFHGGAWVGGPLAQFNDHSRYFASRGLVCIQVQYRLVPNHTTIPPIACIQDARSAMRWVRSHATELGIDPDRIASAGGSAGGHLAAHIGLVNGTDDPADDLSVSARSNAMILFNPVLDNSPGGWGAERVGARYPELSPAQNVSRNAPPGILFLGSKDKLVPVATLQAFQRRMIEAGVRCDLRIYDGQEHGFFNAKNENGKYYVLTVHAADEFLRSLGWVKGEPTRISVSSADEETAHER